MSVIVKDLNTMNIEIYTKGADSAIFSKALPSTFKLSLNNGINDFSKEGFRTLLFSFRTIPKFEY